MEDSKNNIYYGLNWNGLLPTKVTRRLSDNNYYYLHQVRLPTCSPAHDVVRLGALGAQKYTVNALGKVLNFFQWAKSVLSSKQMKLDLQPWDTDISQCMKILAQRKITRHVVVTTLQGIRDARTGKTCFCHTTDCVVNGFDTHWSALGKDRAITKVYPDVFADVERSMHMKSLTAWHVVQIHFSMELIGLDEVFQIAVNAIRQPKQEDHFLFALFVLIWEEAWLLILNRSRSAGCYFNASFC